MQTINRPNKRIVILGGGYAGILAALRLAAKTRKSQVQITLVNGSDTFVERIRLHQAATNQSLKRISIPRLLKGTGIIFVQGWATQIDSAAQTVHVQLADSEVELAYHTMIYALGSSVDLESISGVAQHATALGSPAMARAMGQTIPELARRGGRVLVVGGGLTGIEAATEMAESYPALDVTLATAGKLGAGLSSKGARHIDQICNRLGIHIEEERSIAMVNSDHVVDANGNSLPFDLCLWSAGFSVPQLAADANIATDAAGRILVDENLRSTSHPAIFAVGDSAATPLRMACATAMPMGAYVADFLAATVIGEQAPGPFRYAYALRCISLGRKNGLVQMVDAYDVPKECIFTGRSAVLIKELICRFTIWALKIEKWIPGAYRWPKARLNVESESIWWPATSAEWERALDG